MPERRARLDGLGEWTDDQILELDDVQFDALIQTLILEKQTKEQEKIATELRARQAEVEEKERAVRIREEEAARAETRRLELEVARTEGEKRAKAEAERKIKEAELEAIRKAAAEKAEAERLEKTKKFQVFLKANGYTEETKEQFWIEDKSDVVILWRKINEFKK